MKVLGPRRRGGAGTASGSRSKGQAVAEFALTLTPLMLVFTGTLQLGVILGTQIGLTNAARESARFASVAATRTVTQAQSNGDAVLAYLRGSVLPGKVSSYSAAALVTTGTPHTQVCYESFYDSAVGSYAVSVRLDVVYRHPLFIPLVGNILDGLDGTTDGTLRISSSEELRVDNLPILADPAIEICRS